MNRLCCLLVLSLCFSPTTTGLGQAYDEVVVRDKPKQSTSASVKSDPWLSVTTRVLRGKIEGVNGKELLLVDGSGQPQRVECAQVQSIAVAWQDPAVLAALDLFRQRKYQESMLAINATLAKVPTWQHPLLVAKIVEAASAAGDQRVAGRLFLQLAAADPPPIIYADMPLCWTVCDPNQAMLDAAQQWLAAEGDASKLMGASWLLFSADSETARQALLQLQASENTTIAKLAVAQSWRIEPPPDTMGQLSQWLAFRDSLLEPLQLGPTEFLADRLMRVGQTDLAIGQWMRIATHPNKRHHRAVSSLESAASMFVQLGKTEEAEKVKLWIKNLDGS
ncbi:MAG: hypothetical protein R3C53_02865 [Pirellulaceae bacterium]